MRHPRERSTPEHPLSRRDFLKRTGQGAIAFSSIGALLEACGKGPNAPLPSASGSAAGGLPLARPNNPVKWPIYADNMPIASGLQPEMNATLKLYNWSDYI